MKNVQKKVKKSKNMHQGQYKVKTIAKTCIKANRKLKQLQTLTSQLKESLNNCQKHASRPIES